MAASLLALANFHLQFTNKSVGSLWRPPLARRPLLIALQVVKTSFGFYVRECMRSSPPPPPPGPPNGVVILKLLI